MRTRITTLPASLSRKLMKGYVGAGLLRYSALLDGNCVSLAGEGLPGATVSENRETTDVRLSGLLGVSVPCNVPAITDTLSEGTGPIGGSVGACCGMGLTNFSL